VAEQFLQDYSDYLVTDDYAAYNRLNKLKRASCWAHVRRKFTEVPVGKNNSDTATAAARGIALCNTLFELEQEFVEMTLEQRKTARLEKSVPVLEAFWSYVDDYQGRVLAKTALGKALAYAKHNQNRLMTFLEDGRLEISNAVAENAIRPFAIGRNYVLTLFMCSLGKSQLIFFLFM
jgi:hypothetical protein